jgi:transglutaminase-like putative cysteine protease
MFTRFSRFAGILMTFLQAVLFLPGFSQGTAIPIKFGKIPMEDLAMTRYERDTSANALVLADIGRTWFEYDESRGFTLMHERIFRIKILNKEGYKWANHEISIYGRSGKSETLMTLKGQTHNLENGADVVSKLENSAVFEERADANWTHHKFTLPNVKVGSVLEVRYVIQSPYLFNLRNWYFQDEIPERYSEYEVRIPEFFVYKMQTTGYLAFQVNEQKTETVFSGTLHYQEGIWKLAAENVPAMREEAYTNTLRNYILAVEFELQSYRTFSGVHNDLTTNWKKIIEELLKDEDFGGQLKRAGYLEETVKSIRDKTADPQDQMIQAYDFIRKNITWNGNRSIYPKNSLRSAFSDKQGNSADVNLLLVMLLRQLGFSATPVLSSTRDHGIVVEFLPNLSRLNYVVADVVIGSKEFLLDATDPHRPYTCLPFRCLNGKGILATNDTVRWIRLLGTEKYNTRDYGVFKVDSAGEITGNVTMSYDGYSGLNRRTELESGGQEKFLKDFSDKLRNMTVDSLKAEPSTTAEDGLRITYRMKSQELSQVSGNLIFFNVLLGEGQSTNPLAPERRDYPVDFGCPMKDFYTYVIEIPEGYTVESMPAPASFVLPESGGSFRFMASATGNRITINSNLSINQTFFTVQEYSDLREFFTRIVSKHEEKIVIRKI